MKRIGFTIDVVALEAGALVKRFLSGEPYDAVYFFLIASDTDPAMNLDFWMSSGGAHIWNPGQRTPATDWERQIDDLMRRQTTALDEAERRRLFLDVQGLFAAHLPMVHFAAPRVFVAVSPRVTNLTPAVSRPQLLWAADTIAIKH
jgi:peptide/nickel transport system substrate-binding protein